MAEKKLHSAIEKCRKGKAEASLVAPFSAKVEASMVASQAEADSARDLPLGSKVEALKLTVDSLAEIAPGGPGGEALSF